MYELTLFVLLKKMYFLDSYIKTRSQACPRLLDRHLFCNRFFGLLVDVNWWITKKFRDVRKKSYVFTTFLKYPKGIPSMAEISHGYPEFSTAKFFCVFFQGTFSVFGMSQTTPP